jgi:amidase
MSAKRPTRAQIRQAADTLGLSLDEPDVEEFTQMVGDTLERYYRALERMPQHLPEVKYPRSPGTRPAPEEDPLSAWYVRTTVEGAKRGKLKGKTVAIKDNISLAGVPMMNGASVLEGYVPEIDASVVTRILDAGGTILGKAHCEYFCYSGSSHTNAVATTRNPYNQDYTTGGSSSGCAALVASGAVDLAIGSDQGGSVREPSAFCGLYGMKPSWGLVPYTGAMSIEMTLDHLGPMTRTTADNALFLEVLAGADGLDPRQYAPKTARYTQAIGQGVKGLMIGVVAEGFAHAECDARVDECVREAAKVFADLGAEVREISVPMHREGMAIWVPIAVEGAYEQILKGFGQGHNWKGLYVPSHIAAVAGWQAKSNMFSEIFKLGMLCAEHMRSVHHGRFYAKAQNLSRKLKDAYDAALSEVDLLLMPTTPIHAVKLPPANPTRQEDMSPGFTPIVNTAPLDCTGHPSMNVPCGMLDGLPVGMMLTGKHFDEMTIYRASDAFERAVDWKSR